METDMTDKTNKASAIRDYIKANPTAKPPEIAEKIGCNAAYVYSVTQKVRRRAKAVIKKAAHAPSKGQEVLRKVVSDDEETIANLRFDVALMSDACKAQDRELERLRTIITYLEKFVCTAERVVNL
jgi:hypothetical protein